MRVAGREFASHLHSGLFAYSSLIDRFYHIIIFSNLIKDYSQYEKEKKLNYGDLKKEKIPKTQRINEYNDLEKDFSNARALLDYV